MKKITISKEDIAGIEVTVDAWVFTLNETKPKPQNQQEIENIHSKSGKFGGDCESLT